MKNRKLIRILKKERRKLYPHGIPIQPRGCSKTYTYLAHALRYIAYDVVISDYRNVDKEVSLEEAHKDMNEFVADMWKEVKY